MLKLYWTSKVRSEHERPADCDWDLNPYKWILSTSLWPLLLSLAGPCLLGMVFQPDTPLLSYISTKLPIQSTWRTSLEIVVMLLVAVIPTANFDWPNSQFDMSMLQDGDSGPLPSSYAICQFGRKADPGSSSFPPMIVSTLLICFGFASRVIRLHRSLTENVFGNIRKTLSEKVRALLRRT